MYIYKKFFIQVYGKASLIPKEKVIELGWILNGADLTSLENLPVDDSDIVAYLGATDRQLPFEKVYYNEIDKVCHINTNWLPSSGVLGSLHS